MTLLHVAVAVEHSQQDVAQSLLVSWRNPETKRYSLIGTLMRCEDEFIFEYRASAVETTGFLPIMDFLQTSKSYRSNYIFPFFSDRVPSMRRDDRPDWLRYVGSPEDTDIFEILKYSFGRNGTDHYEFFPAPVQEDDSWTAHMPLHGVRYHPITEQLIASGDLGAGTELHLVPEPDNEFDERAQSVMSAAGDRLGYLSSAFLDYLEDHSDFTLRPTVSVVRLNEPPAGAHLRLVLRVCGGVQSTRQ